MMLSLVKRTFFAAFPRQFLVTKAPDSQKLFLTFDDGPHPNTPRILDLLERENIKATFFMVGTEIKKYPELAREVVARGHEAASHSWHHRRYRHTELAALRREIEDMERLLSDVCGIQTRTFRPPYGRLTVPLLYTAVQRDMKIVLWSLNSEDCHGADAVAARRNCRRAAPGDILLFHDDSPQIVDVTKAVIDELKGTFKFGTVNEIGGEPVRRSDKNECLACH